MERLKDEEAGVTPSRSQATKWGRCELNLGPYARCYFAPAVRYV